MTTDANPILREFRGEADLDALIELLQAVAEHDKDGLEVSIDEVRFEWIDVEPGWVRDLQVWEAGERFVASVGAFRSEADEEARVYLWHDVHPDWREPAFVDETTAVTRDASARLVDGPAAMRAVSGPNQEWKRSSLERAGFELIRYYYRMCAPIHDPIALPDLPHGFMIRPLDPEREVEEWIATVNAGFAAHFDNLPTTLEERRHRMTVPGYMPEADLVLLNDRNEIVGVGFNSRETLVDGVERGWVNLLTILPTYRGQGLGRALLLHSMAALQNAGFAHAYLSVDSGNETGALKLYQSAGFEIEHQFLLYVRDVEQADIPA